MRTLAYRIQLKDVRSAGQTMRVHGATVSGPYRRRNGMLSSTSRIVW